MTDQDREYEDKQRRADSVLDLTRGELFEILFWVGLVSLLVTGVHG